MPSLSCTVGEQIEALRSVAGSEAVGLIKEEPDPFVQTIVSSWARGFDTRRATALGFTSENSFEEIVRIYVEDDLPIDSAN